MTGSMTKAHFTTHQFLKISVINNTMVQQQTKGRTTLNKSSFYDQMCCTRSIFVKKSQNRHSMQSRRFDTLWGKTVFFPFANTLWPCFRLPVAASNTFPVCSQTCWFFNISASAPSVAEFDTASKQWRQVAEGCNFPMTAVLESQRWTKKEIRFSSFKDHFDVN